MGQCRAECRIFRVLNCESNFLKYISAVVQKNVIPLNEEMTFFLRTPYGGQRPVVAMALMPAETPSPAS